MSNQTNAVTIATPQPPHQVFAPFAVSPASSVKPRRTSKSRAEPLRSSSSEAYAKDARLFAKSGGVIPCDARAIETYIRAMRNKLAPQTIHRRVMAVRHEHLRLGHPSPTDTPALKLMLRQLQMGIVPTKAGGVPSPVTKRKEPQQAKPVTRQLLAKMLDAMGTNALDRRDRCLLLLGFAGALPRSTLVALDVADLRFTNDVLVVTVRAAESTDAEPARVVTVPITGHELCAASATKNWIEHAALDIEGGPLLRRFDRGGDPTPNRLDSAWVSVVVKTRLKAVGIDPEPYSGLSLRRGRLMELGKGVL